MMTTWTTMNSRMGKTSLGLLLLLIGVSGCSSTDNPTPTLPPDPAPSLTDIRWEWISLTTPVEQIDIDAPERYYLEFSGDGKFGGKADCNQLFGQYTAEAHRITLSGIGTTKMLCPPGSHFDRFVRDLGQVAVYSFLDDGDLILELPVDSGTLRFRR